MWQSFLYIISFVGFVAACTYYPKVKNINFITCVMFSYVTALCYGAAGALILQTAGIAIHLLSVSIIYLIGAVALWIVIIRKKKVQKFEFRKCDMIALIVFTLIVGRIAIHIFSRRLEINYRNMIDSANHYQMAMNIVRSQKLNGMFFAQFHNAMFINMCMPFIPEAWSYKAFILADCFQTLMQCFFIYGGLVYICRNSKHKYMPILITLLYWCGYPMYSFACGAYIYWAMGSTLVLYVIFLLKIYEEKQQLRRLCVPLIVLGAFGSTVCYVQYTPAVFLMIFAVIVYRLISEGRLVINKKLLVGAGIVCAIGAAFAGIGYYFIFARSGQKIFEVFGLGSNTSKNLEIIVFIPIIYYLVYQQYKKKTWNAYGIGLCSFLIVQFAFVVLAAVNIVSSYYLFKYYFIFWAFCWILVLDEGQYITEKARHYMVNYVLIAVIFLMFIFVPQQEVETTDVYSIDNSIWRHNAVVVSEDYREPYLNTTKVALMEYICENYNAEDTQIVMLGTNATKGTCAWYQGITNQPIYWVSPLTRERIESYLQSTGVQYILVFTDCEAYEDNAEYFDSFEKVYELGEGFVAKVY